MARGKRNHGRLPTTTPFVFFTTAPLILHRFDATNRHVVATLGLAQHLLIRTQIIRTIYSGVRIRLSTIGNVSCTLQYTLYRRTCRRVFPIGNVLRKSVPRRTVIWTDDRVTTRFGSFSSLFLLRAAKKNIIIIFPSCSSQSQSQLLIAHSLLLDALYIISTM